MRIASVVGLLCAMSTGVHVVSNTNRESCDAPHFETAAWSVPNGSSIVSAIAIQPDDLSRDKLFCLSNTLKRAYAKYRQIGIVVFTSRTALADYRGPSPGENGRGYSKVTADLHAEYWFDKDQHMESLTMRPLGGQMKGAFDSDFDLTKPIHACRFEIGGRCLTIFQGADYPEAMIAKNLGGNVTLSATLKRNGLLRDIRVLGGTVTDEQREELGRAAARNLATWRFESGTHEDPIRLTYEFVIDHDTRPVYATPRIALHLPERVTVMVSSFRP